MDMRTPGVTLALMFILALGFATGAMGDDSTKSGSVSTKTSDTKKAGATTGTTPTTPATPAPAGDHGATTPTTAAGPPADTGAPTDPGEVLPPAAAPVLDKSAAVAPVEGEVTIKLPGRDDYVPLADPASVPMGATVDARAGAVRLTSAHNAQGTPQSATFHGGVFTVTGQTTGSRPVTELRLRGGDFSSCAKARFARKAGSKPVRQLWGSGHGRFRTRGRYSAATVHGTIWLTRDTCDGTLTVVRRGIVDVRDFVRHRTTYVRAGHRLFTPAPAAQHAPHAF